MNERNYQAQNFTIKRINKGLKRRSLGYPKLNHFTIKRINKGLKRSPCRL